jgi:hypothetical protein
MSVTGIHGTKCKSHSNLEGMCSVEFGLGPQTLIIMTMEMS